ncbi:MAG: hypothetical protein H6708_17730 [Kofleriaceae bacterium]|nr:hypothetical protein [Kofleriaceae bacterium]
MIVASHNLMHARRLDALLPHHLALRDDVGLDVLCVQEDVALGDTTAADRIAAALGPGYAVARAAEAPGLAVVHDTATAPVAPGAVRAVPLPRLGRLSPIERLYIAGGKTKQKHALLVTVGHAADLYLIVDAHLDTAGDNAHRAAQVAAVAAALDGSRFVFCADTNSFTWRRARHAAALAELLAPLTALGAAPPEAGAPTHFFARQREPLLTHRLTVALGALGLDLPRAYDVVCSNVTVTRRGQLETPASDHDLVWAELAGAEPRP